MGVLDKYLGKFLPLGDVAMIVIDSIMLILLVLPALYVLLFKPLTGTVVALVTKEAELSEQKQFTENVIQNSTIPLFVIDTTHKVIFWNRACEELTGIPAKEIVGTGNHWKAFADTYRPLLCDIVLDGATSDSQGYYTKFGASPLLGHGAYAEAWFENLNGKKRYLHFSAAPIFNSRNEVISVMETLVDITENKNYEEALRSKSMQISSILDNMHNGILFEDEDDRIILASKSFCEMFNLNGEPEQLVGRSSKAIMTCIQYKFKSPEQFKAETDRLLADRTTVGISEHTMTNDWHIRREHVPILENGSVSGHLWIFRDQTKAKALEMQLRHSQKMESIGLLAGGIAHDFNNTLTIILSYASLLKDKLAFVKDRQVSEYVEHILSAGQRTADLTKSLLAFSRKQVITPEMLDLNRVVSDVAMLLERVLSETISLKIHVDAEPLHTLADKSLIEHMLLNLVTNAKDAMPDGGILTIETGAVDIAAEETSAHDVPEPGKYVFFMVRDTGIGISESIKDKIFEPFFSTKEIGKGTGLGLSLVYGTIKQHGGGIKVTSVPSCGTTFKIFLPAAVNGELKSKKSVQRLTKSIYQGTETILMAEDDPIIRQIQKLVLSGSGYKVLEARDGKEAIEVFTRNREEIQLVIMDIMMPVMNGKEAYTAIAALKPGIRVLFISGYAGEHLARLGFAEGMNFIAKPVTPRLLLEKVRAVLDTPDADALLGAGATAQT